MQKNLEPSSQNKVSSPIKKILDIPFSSWLGIVGFSMGAIAMVAFFSQRTDVELLKTELRDFNAKAHVTQIEENVNKLIDKSTYQETQIQSIVEQVQKEVDKLNQNLQKTNLAISKQSQVLKKSFVGKVKVPANSKQKEPVAPAAKTGDAWETHTVKPGDTLGKIAKQYGISLQAIQAANPSLNSSHLKVGSSVRIP